MDPLHLQVIRSSSAGNCTAIWNDRACLLVDAGVPVKLIRETLGGRRIDAVLITHAHRDHLSDAAFNLFRKQHVPVYMGNAEIEAYYRERFRSLRSASGVIRRFLGRPFSAGPFDVDPVAVSHDSAGGCFGFSIACNGRKIAYATDLVEAPDGLADRFAGADALVIESNHDPRMLADSGRPPHVKKRIREYAHLSNGKCGAFLRKVLAREKRPRVVMPAHISEECNTREIVMKTVSDALAETKSAATEVVMTFRDRASRVLVL
jgi:phosphoribosyl 1,2-cyclic phosphodiesterase